MGGRHGSAESPQDQVVFRVVPCVPYRYVLEQTTFCAKYLVGPVVHLLSAPVYGPCVAVLQPRLLMW